MNGQGVRDVAEKESDPARDFLVRELFDEVTDDERAVLEEDLERWADNLTELGESIQLQITRNKAALDALQTSCLNRDTQEAKREFFEAKAEHEEWRSRALVIMRRAQRRRVQLKKKIKERNIEVAREDNNRKMWQFIDAVKTHREETEAGDFEPTDADDRLWRILDRLYADEL